MRKGRMMITIVARSNDAVRMNGRHKGILACLCNVLRKYDIQIYIVETCIRYVIKVIYLFFFFARLCRLGKSNDVNESLHDRILTWLDL